MIISDSIWADRHITLRLIFPRDVGPTYPGWMRDADVNKYTEQRYLHVGLGGND